MDYLLIAKLIVPCIVVWIMLGQLLRKRAFVRIGALKAIKRDNQPRLYWLLILSQGIVYSYVIYMVFQ
jgi:hypothetical protein